MQNKNFYNKELVRWIQEKAVNYWWTLNSIFEQLPDVYFLDQKWIIQSCNRYFNIFLPLLKYSKRFNFPLVPPPDVELVWMCHIMAPESYKSDCQKFFEFVPDHSLLDFQSRQKALNFTKFIWFSQYPKQSFYLNFENQCGQNNQKFGFKQLRKNSLKKFDKIRKIAQISQQIQNQQQQQQQQSQQQIINNQQNNYLKIKNTPFSSIPLHESQEQQQQLQGEKNEEKVFLLDQQLQQINLPFENQSHLSYQISNDSIYSDDQFELQKYGKIINQNQFDDQLNSEDQNCGNDFDLNSKNCDILRNFSMDIISAIQTLRIFYFQVNLPHFKDTTFIKRGILMYVCAIDANMEFENFSTGFNFYLLWHTHLLHPKKYKKDTQNIRNGNYSHFQNEFSVQNTKQLTQKQRNKFVNEFWRKRQVKCGLEGAQFWGIPNLCYTPNFKENNSDCGNDSNSTSNLFGVTINLVKQGKFKQQNILHKLPFSKKQYVLQNQQELKHNLKQIKQFTIFANHIFEFNSPFKKNLSQKQQQLKFYARVILNPVIQLHAVDIYNNPQIKNDQKIIQIHQIGNEVLPSPDDVSSELRKKGYPFFQKENFYVQMCILGKKIAIFEASVDGFGTVNIQVYWLQSNNNNNNNNNIIPRNINNSINKQKYVTDINYNVNNKSSDQNHQNIYGPLFCFQSEEIPSINNSDFDHLKCNSSKIVRGNNQLYQQENNIIITRNVVLSTQTKSVYITKVPIYGTQKETSIKLDVTSGECTVDDVMYSDDGDGNSVFNRDFILYQSFGVFMSVGVLLAKCQKDVAKILGNTEENQNLQCQYTNFCKMFGAGHKMLPVFQKRIVQLPD